MIRAFAGFLAGLAALVVPAVAQDISTPADFAYMIDVDTGTVLLSKQADEPVPPASMAKLMTLEIVFEAIRNGDLSAEDEFFVSEHAWRTGGAPSRTATMFADVNSNVALADLLRGIMVQGANDASIAIAEGMAGTEDAFAGRMNQRAQELGLEGATFANPSGLPGGEQRISMRALVELAQHVIERHRRLYRIFSEPEFTWNGIRQLNRNPVFASGIGVDGLLAGYDEATGYGMIASAVIDGRRIILAVHGLSSPAERVSEVQKLLLWGARSFEQIELFAADQQVGDVGVYGGSPGRIGVGGKEPIRILVPATTGYDLRARIVYEGPLRAPVGEGDPVGVLRISNGETVVAEKPLFALEPAGPAALPRRAFDAAFELVVGLVHSGVEAATSQ